MTSNTNAVAAVDSDYYFQPMKSCPLSQKVQLLGRGGVAVYGTYDGKNTFWIGWAKCPKIPNDLKGLL